MQSHSAETDAIGIGRRPLRSIDELPGPTAWPLVGNVLQLKWTRAHLDVERWCRKYGRLFRMRFGPIKVLVVADHEAIGAILRDRPAGFRRPSGTAEVAHEMGGIPGVFLAEGDEWRRQRRMVMPGLAPVAVKTYFPTLLKVAARLRRRWENAARLRTPIDLSGDLKRYTVDVIAGLAFGTDVNTLESDADVIQQHMDIVMAGVARRSLSLIPYWRYVKLPVDRQLDRSVAALSAAADDFIAKARKRMEVDPSLRAQPRNLLEAMIAAADEPDSGVSDSTVAGNVSTMLLAGEDTTANTLAWMLYLLSRHPDALKRAQNEVLNVAPDSSVFTIEQMDALDYVDACAQEAMRLKPVAPFMPLEALRDTVVSDVHVPAGTIVWCVLRHDGVDERYFPRADAFDPERWLNANAEGTGTDKRVTMPFGGGPRTCPGRYLALLEIKIAMAVLLGSFDIEAVETPDGKEATELMAFVMSPIGLKMRIRERNNT
jgi:cytochrome P450